MDEHEAMLVARGGAIIHGACMPGVVTSTVGNIDAEFPSVLEYTIPVGDPLTVVGTCTVPVAMLLAMAVLFPFSKKTTDLLLNKNMA